MISSMQHGVVVRGRLRGKRIELDEEVTEFEGDVEVFVCAAQPANESRRDFLAVVAGLPDGTRTKLDIDQDLAQTRGEWDGRA